MGARTRVREIPVCLSGKTKEIKKKGGRKYVKDKKDVRGVAKTEEAE